MLKIPNVWQNFKTVHLYSISYRKLSNFSDNVETFFDLKLFQIFHGRESLACIKFIN